MMCLMHVLLLLRVTPTPVGDVVVGVAMHIVAGAAEDVAVSGVGVCAAGVGWLPWIASIARLTFLSQCSPVRREARATLSIASRR